MRLKVFECICTIVLMWTRLVQTRHRDTATSACEIKFLYNFIKHMYYRTKIDKIVVYLETSRVLKSNEVLTTRIYYFTWFVSLYISSEFRLVCFILLQKVNIYFQDSYKVESVNSALESWSFWILNIFNFVLHQNQSHSLNDGFGPLEAVGCCMDKHYIFLRLISFRSFVLI